MITDIKLLIHNLYRQFDKDKWNIERNLLNNLQEVILVSKKSGYKISMTIKLEKEEK